MKASSMSSTETALRLLLILFVTLSCGAGGQGSLQEQQQQQQHDHVQTSRVAVQIPYPLHDVNGDEHVTAQFGFGTTAGQLGAYVYYTEASLCFGFPETDKNGTATAVYPQRGDRFVSPFILMLPSSTAGHCSYVTLTREAQLLGASAVVFAHDQCRCSDLNCTAAFGSDCTWDKVELVSKDGHYAAQDVAIPAFLLYKLKAHKVIEEMKTKNQPVLMELGWGLPNATASSTEDAVRVRHQLWSTATDHGLLDVLTLKHFKTVATAFVPHGAAFEPKFAMIAGHRYGCDSQTDIGPTAPCDHLCTNRGRYCASTPYKLSGHVVVNETLRRLCIWQEYGNTDRGAPYWDYVIYHREQCRYEYYADSKCLADAYKHSLVDATLVDKCMADSGGIVDDHQNSLLQQQLDDQSSLGVVTTPAVTVNSRILTDSHSYGLLEGLCRSYWSRNWTTAPKACYTCYKNCPNPIDCLQADGVCNENPVPDDLIPDDEDRNGDAASGDGAAGGGGGAGKRRGWRIFWWMFFLTAGAAGGYVYYKKRQEEGGFGGGTGSLNSYFRLSGEEN